IVSEAGIAAGVRRIEAVTGMGAVELFEQRDEQLRQAALALRTTVDALPSRLTALQDENKRLRKELEKAARSESSGLFDAVVAAEERAFGLRLFLASVDANGEQLLGLVDQLKARRNGGCVVALVGKEGERAPIIVFADPAAQAAGIRAGDLCRE